MRRAPSRFTDVAETKEPGGRGEACRRGCGDPRAFDLTGSLRDAAEFAGSSPNTVARCVRLRARGRPLDEPVRRNQLIDPYLDAAYENCSLTLTSNLHPAQFDAIFPKGLATAAVDRLLHHAHVIVTEGQSHRLAEAVEGRGVRPLQSVWAC